MRRLALALALVLVAAAPLGAADEPVRLPVPADLLAASETAWFGIYMQGSKIGWGSMTLGRTEIDGRPVLAGRDEMHIRSTVLGEAYEMRIDSEMIFDLEPPHALRQGWHETVQGDDRQRVEVRRAEGTYLGVIVQAGEQRTQPLHDLDTTFADLSTVVAWFRAPREVGDRLAFRTFDLSELEADVETVTVRSVNRSVADGVPLTWYEASAHSERDGDMGTLRMDVRGRMLSALIGGAIEIRLEPKDVAQQPSASVDLFVSRTAKIDAPLGDPREIAEMVVRITGPGTDSVKSGPWQTATYSMETQTLTLEIGRRHDRGRPATEAEIRRALEEKPAYPIRDPRILALAQAAVGEVEDPFLRVVRLVAFVEAFVRDDYHAEPLTVLDLIQVRKGDCSEHAMLFTTLARALGIPAREVTGIAYMGDEFRAFGGHAWNEVLLDGRWVPVDPTWGEVEVDATHIRQASEGEGAAAYFALGGAQIELVSAVKRRRR